MNYEILFNLFVLKVTNNIDFVFIRFTFNQFCYWEDHASNANFIFYPSNKNLTQRVILKLPETFFLSKKEPDL